MPRLSGYLALILAIMPQGVSAWTRQGHMVTAQIAYDQLVIDDPAVIDAAAAILEHHPDRGAFGVAIGRATGRERARRLLLECSRWPDDARETAYDHPHWHAVVRPVVSQEAPPPNIPASDRPLFEAVEAFELNFRTLKSAQASLPERAVAMCWVLHVAGDIHQPLHAAQFFSTQFPAGDYLGQNQYVKDPQTGEVVSLHRYWDDVVNKSDEQPVVIERARALIAKFPRSGLVELARPTRSSDFDLWARSESYPIAVQYAYHNGQTFGRTPQEAPPLTDDYVRTSRNIAERRAAIAGYRMADLLREALGQ